MKVCGTWRLAPGDPLDAPAEKVRLRKPGARNSRLAALRERIVEALDAQPTARKKQR